MPRLVSTVQFRPENGPVGQCVVWSKGGVLSEGISLLRGNGRGEHDRNIVAMIMFRLGLMRRLYSSSFIWRPFCIYST